MCKFITNGLEKDREVGGGAAGWIGHWSLLLGGGYTQTLRRQTNLLITVVSKCVRNLETKTNASLLQV
ncbi:hypothetical protein [Paenibacillus sp. CF095]|uniref:hypothetical protein n=1 Tax=Paenibacillus sp. CF095 TaxID=1881033 RepID=UPI00115FB397|nr:hypothetical protein [Paenibacillus sp. CF095]